MNSNRHEIAAAATFFIFALAALPGRAAEQWGVEEIVLQGPSGRNSYRDVQLSGRFTQGNGTIVVPGFWDGGETYRIRFSPPAQGEWRYETKSDAAELNGKTGALVATKPAANNHGPVQVYDTYYLRYADGTPYHQFGTTCYAWVHQTRELQEQTLKTLAASPFNKIRFCVFPKSYAYNQNEPEIFAFKKGPDGKLDFNQPDPAFWRHFEAHILNLQKLGIEADLILWHPYDRWGLADMSDEQDDRYLRYCIARLSVFRNVWWSLANEYDFMTERPAGHRGNKQWEDWDRFFAILQKEDPHQRFRGIHNGRKWYDHTRGWVTHASLQTSDMEGGVRYRMQYRKPVIYDECKYEGNIPQGWGNLTARQMTQRFWLGTLSGCYVGHGETYKHSQDLLWWAKGGVLHGESPQRIRWLKDFMAEAPPFHELKPTGDGKGTFVLAKDGEYYLVYCTDQRSQTIRLTGTSPYKLDRIDPWEMTVTPVGTASPGEFTFSAAKGDLVYRFSPYQAGEKLRPEARITASVTEGVPPLKVQFANAATGQVEWDFGDGTISKEARPTHVFEKPGLYAVKLTVSEPDGGSAQAFQSIAVDQDPSEPILRVGLPPETESPKVKLHGTAKRTVAGGFQLPDGAPWGWIQVGDGAIESVRGLRSFTVMGWLKPESLQVGSGGNRILFCLKESRSGIDLVCQKDGSLRLAVNQWPDSVRNDSSPAKLHIGKWTAFAVSYDATASGDNVSWYFSAPTDSPGQTALSLDRKTAYHAGPVDSETGPLVIGNFNETMHGYGLDRQFRGEIRAVQMFGSRVSGRGALKVDDINSRIQSLASSAKATESSSTGTSAPKSTVRSLARTEPSPQAANVRQRMDKPRIINTTDLGADPDDEQSLVRQLVCANEFDIEGLIVSTGCWKKSQSNTKMLDKIVDAYGQALPNLRVHAEGFPSVEYLRSISVMGQKGYGMSDVGAGKDSPGSELIIASVDKDDPRPVWVGCWGGANNVAQAIWKVRETRSKAELTKFLSKLHVFDILGQDDAGAWIAKNFPEVFYIRATGVYGWQPPDDYLDKHIQSHGPLGAVYPDRKYATEGDTPAFMHVYPNGLNDPDKIDQGGWGGRFSLTKKTGIKSMSGVKQEERAYDPYDMYGNTSEGAKAVKRWSKGYDNDFAARMDWSITSKYSEANHHPVAVVNGDTSKRVLEVSASPGSSVTLRAVGSSDPDKDSLAYSWSFYKEPSSYHEGSVAIDGQSSNAAKVSVPSNASGKSIHIILEVNDDGEPNLYAYRRVILNVK